VVHFKDVLVLQHRNSAFRVLLNYVICYYSCVTESVTQYSLERITRACTVLKYELCTSATSDHSMDVDISHTVDKSRKNLSIFISSNVNAF
jgi:hypothetical protein